MLAEALQRRSRNTAREYARTSASVVCGGVASPEAVLKTVYPHDTVTTRNAAVSCLYI